MLRSSEDKALQSPQPKIIDSSKKRRGKANGTFLSSCLSAEELKKGKNSEINNPRRVCERHYRPRFQWCRAIKAFRKDVHMKGFYSLLVT